MLLEGRPAHSHRTPSAHPRQRVLLAKALRRLARAHPTLSVMQLVQLLTQSPHHRRFIRALQRGAQVTDTAANDRLASA